MPETFGKRERKKTQERKAALALIQYEKSKHPSEVPDELISIALPALIEIARNDPNPEVAQEANQMQTKVNEHAERDQAAGHIRHQPTGVAHHLQHRTRVARQERLLIKRLAAVTQRLVHGDLDT